MRLIFAQTIQAKMLIILLIIANMSRILKHPNSIGKLSTRKFNVFQLQNDKKISAVLPMMHSKSRKSKISQSALFAEGKEDPLPYIKKGAKPLNTKIHQANNPQEEVFYVDGSKKKIGHCIAIQMSSPRHFQAGKFYNPSMQILSSPGKIRHQSSSEIKKKPSLEKAIQNFKDFMQNRYVQEMSEKRKGVTMVEYDRHFGDLVSSTMELNRARYKLQQKQQAVLPISSQSELKPVYLSTNFVKTNQIFLKNCGNCYIQCNKDEIQMLQQQLQEGNSQVSHLLLSSTSSHATVDITFQTSISKIKQILIEEKTNLHLSFNIPTLLQSSLKNLSSHHQFHWVSQQIFKQMINFKPQLVSIKNFANCILLISRSPQSSSRSYCLMWYFSGSFYFGGWNNSKDSLGCKTGIGLQYTSSQSIYFGEFIDNQRQGYGVLKKANGESYVGEWKQGQRSGWGKFFESSGYLSLDGIFQDDNFVGTRLESKMIAV